jgi:L-ribulose-5-phosphate 3-epimerase
MTAPFQLAAVTDEFSNDLERALRVMAEVHLTGVELRMIWGRNIVDLDDAELDRVRKAVEQYGMTVLSIASPVLKCVLPDAPPVDPRLQQDSFASGHTFADQPALSARAFAIAERTGARIVRVFSCWRSQDPEACFDRVAEALRDLAERAAGRGLIIGLENEHACNIATGAEAARLLAAVDHPSLQLIWDPANALVAGETPFPDGYRHLSPSRIVHVHAKDCLRDGGSPTWTELGRGDVDWRGQFRALADDGYRGAISLETHWTGPRGDKLEASQICAHALRALVG